MEARLSTCHTASLEVIDLDGCSIGTNGQTTLTFTASAASASMALTDLPT